MRIFIAFLLFLGLVAETVLAQQPPISDPPDEPIRGTGRLESMDSWTIRPQLQTLEQAMRDYEPLLNTLHQANSDLGSDLKQYLENPEDRLAASRVQVKLSSYARTVVSDFDRVIGKQDLLLSTFREVQYRLKRFSHHVSYKAVVYNKQHQNFKKKGKKIGKELHDLATQIRTASSPEEEARLKREFRRRYLSWKIHNRYVKGYDRTREQYERLAKNLDGLAQVFERLQSAYLTLIENIEAEKQFLRDNIQLVMDTLRADRMVETELLAGRQAIQVLVDKLAHLYERVDAFSQIQAQMNDNLGRFGNGTALLEGLQGRIEDIGEPKLGSGPEALERAIDEFYRKVETAE
ncbi:MAG: hypothetical protein QF752_03560 [Planctomycetota bacterium]|nr:hypothetical protein [Planctomycetota bacterium]